MVYVLSKTGQPIMPTKNHAKVRLLLNSGKAKVVKRTPFTIQLTGVSKTYTQDITLGVDAGSKKIDIFINNVLVRTATLSYFTNSSVVTAALSLESISANTVDLRRVMIEDIGTP